MGRAASLHDDQGDGSILEERFELRTTQSMALTSLPASIGHGQLEHVLGQIDADDHPVTRISEGLGNTRLRSSIHLGLLHVAPSLHTT